MREWQRRARASPVALRLWSRLCKTNTGKTKYKSARETALSRGGSHGHYWASEGREGRGQDIPANCSFCPLIHSNIASAGWESREIQITKLDPRRISGDDPIGVCRRQRGGAGLRGGLTWNAMLCLRFSSAGAKAVRAVSGTTSARAFLSGGRVTALSSASARVHFLDSLSLSTN